MLIGEKGFRSVGNAASNILMFFLMNDFKSAKMIPLCTSKYIGGHIPSQESVNVLGSFESS